LRYGHDVAFALKLIIALLVIISIMCFFFWEDPLKWLKAIQAALRL
jgi:hypothetical protein